MVDGCGTVHVQCVPVSSGTDVDACCLTAGLEPVGQGDVVPKQAVARHRHPNHARQDRPRVDPDPHLKTPAHVTSC